MANQLLARLGIVMGVDSSELEVGLNKAKEQFKGFTKEVQRQSNEAAKMTMALKMATESYGKSLSEVEKVELELKHGRLAGNMVSEQQIKLLRDQAAAYDAVKNAAEKANKAQSSKNGLSAQQSAALGYQTTDIVTSLLGGQNPLMVMIQQGGQLRDQFGGFKPLFEGIATALTPMRIAIGGIVGVISALSYAMYQASEESKKFNNSLILTGNFAGTTALQFNALSNSISSKFNISIGDTKAAMQAVVSSGQFTATSLESVGNLIAKMSRLTGESAATTAEKLIPSLDGTASSAKRLNEQYHFLTLEQYRHIYALNEQGKSQEAIKFTTDALTKRLSEQKEQVGNLEGAWRSLKNGVSSFFESLKVAVGPTSLEKQVQMAAEAIEKAAQPGAGRMVDQGRINAAIDRYMQLAKLQQDAALAENAAAEAKSKAAEKTQQAIKDDDTEGLKRIQAQRAKIIADINFSEEAKGLDKIATLREKRNRELAEVDIKAAARTADEKRKFGWQLEKNDILEKFAIEERFQRAAQELSDEQKKKWQDRAIADQNSIDKENERLAIYEKNVLASKEDLDIAFLRLKTQQNLIDLGRERNMLEPDRLAAAKRIEELSKEREAVILRERDLVRLQEINQTVFANMSSALESFVRTGKFSFRDLALSIYRDLTMIEMKAQATSIWKSIGGLSGIASMLGIGGGVGGAKGPDNIDVGGGWSPRASGGSVTGNSPYLVGEQGPELFVPNGSGTIMPNNMMGSALGGTTNVTNNYINAIDTKSFEDRLLGSSKTIWAANKYGEKNLSLGTGRT